MNIFVGERLKSAILKPYSVTDFPDFCNRYLNNPLQGTKDGPYFTTASEVRLTGDHYRRNNETHSKSWLGCIDGDKSLGDDESCVLMKNVHDVMVKFNINHAIYSSYSHVPGVKNKWRLVFPCEIFGTDQHRKTVAGVHLLLFKNGCEKLVVVRESLVLSQFWFLPRMNNIDRFEYYGHHAGNNLAALDDYPPDWDLVPKDFKGVDSNSVKVISGRKEADMIEILVTGKNPLHATMNDYIYGKVKDGFGGDRLKDHMSALTASWNLNDTRLNSRKKDINRLIDTAVNKFPVDEGTPEEWKEDKKGEDKRVYTKYPDQGGWFEQLVDCIFKWMPYPNRPIAVVSARAVISVLGGRVYSFIDGGGIIYTCLLTGRSTIGKGFVKDSVIWVLDQLGPAELKISSRFTGSSFYTSVKNMVYELTEKDNALGSILSVRSESGQTDQSKAGDMVRVRAFELEVATASGKGGFILPGGQNDKIPGLYSPAITTVRESVAEIQNQADYDNDTTVSGKDGRQSRIIADPLKPHLNRDRMTHLPVDLLTILKTIYGLAANENRTNVMVPVPENLWFYVRFEDENKYNKMIDGWTDLDNKAAIKKDNYTATFYGRFNMRLKAYAAALAIMDNPLYPVITNDQLDISESSLMAELAAHHKQIESGELDGPWAIVMSKLLKVFKGDMSKRKTFKLSSDKMLKEGAVKWKDLRRVIERCPHNKELSKGPFYHRQLDDRLEAEGIKKVNEAEALTLYATKGKVYRRS
ncbi:MAG: hypothetical protein ABUK08_00375 [Candidatus Humimicrobiaceae bacterium]